MSRSLIGVFDLLDRRTKKFVECQLFDEIAENNSADFIKSWRPLFEAKRAELATAGRLTDETFREFSLQDAHWLWPEKAASVATNGSLRSFAIECEGMTQGLMIAAPFGFAREQSQHGLGITQVLLLSTAPWNRPKLVATPRYKGIGRTLLSAAVSLSLEEEQCGRIGLHALSGAESWYRDDCGMTDLGPDPDKAMRYFEMTEAQAKRFLS